MFCNQCGTEIAAGSNLCPNCARMLNVLAAAPGPSRLERHLRTLGILWMIGSALLLIPAFALMLIGSLVHFSIPGAEHAARIIAPFALFVVGSIFALVSSCGIFVGWGLMKHHSWARIAAIVLAVMVLFHFPFGTALGIYTLWVLLSDDGTQYQRLATQTT
jgi:cell division protein FtsW (lipid II flippase)